MLKQLRQKVASSHFFGLSIDESAAVDGTEYLSLEIFFLGDDGKSKNGFLKLQPITQLAAAAITASVVCSSAYISIIQYVTTLRGTFDQDRLCMETFPKWRTGKSVSPLGFAAPSFQ
jgi:hypothetical protein